MRGWARQLGRSGEDDQVVRNRGNREAASTVQRLLTWQPPVSSVEDVQHC